MIVYDAVQPLTVPSVATRPLGTAMEALRRSEYGRLDAADQAYLDYTGTALYAASQLAAHHRRLARAVLGNPHSENPAAMQSTARMERARRRVLAFFDADPDRYEVIFTANASAALQRVGESFPFEPGSRFVLTADNHNSVNGIRCYAERRGAEVRYVPLEGSLHSADPHPWLRGAAMGRPHLFAFPAQSNFSGVRHPLDWVERAGALGFQVLLDAAAFVPTCRLSLAEVQPAFVCLSFYKMFGYPTGVGALIARRDALALLRRPWFGGGTVEWVSTQHGEHALRPGAHRFEDGTPNFLAFDDVCDGLDFLDRLGMERIGGHVAAMTGLLLSGLTALRHPDGRPLITLHGPDSLEGRGGTVAFSVRDVRGEVVPFDEVVARAAARHVSVRGGCFCNPGCAEVALAFPAERARECRRALGVDFSIPHFAACLGGPVGAVRASVGIPTVPADIERLLGVLESYRGARIRYP